VSAKDDEPALTIPLLIKRVRQEHSAVISDEVVLAESTVHRLLARRGLMRKPSDPTSKDHRRFEYDAAGELWMSDVMYGPKIREQRQLRRTYLIALRDDATSIVPYAAFMFSEGTIAYLQVLEQAIRRRGIPKRLYVDNGSAFRSRQLGVVCAKLGIALIHARPYTPQGKGKMERWFRTVRMQHLPLLAAEHLSSLDAMNRALAAWIEGEYHHAPHRGLHGETPADKWAHTSAAIRMPESNVGEMFLSEQRRRVQKDRTVTLEGVAFEVDAALVRDHVTLRYDPRQATGQAHRRGLAPRKASGDRAARRRARQLLRQAQQHHAPATGAQARCRRHHRRLVVARARRSFGRPGRRRAFLMYRKHFALTRHPFDKDLAADDLFASASLAERNARLKYLVDMRGIGLVTGDSGSGKTTTCRHLVAGLHTGLYRVMYVSMTTGNVMDLYRSCGNWVCRPNETVPLSSNRYAVKCRDCARRTGYGHCSSSTRLITCGPICSKIFAC
jgi:transposase InsO family protein